MKKTIPLNSRKAGALVLVLALGLASVSMGVEGTWTQKADMPTARSGLSTSVVDGKIYAIGGIINGTSASLSIVEEYDSRTDTWSTRTNMPSARYAHGAGVVEGKVYIIGGAQTVLGSGLSTVEEYDPVSDTWTTKADMPTARRCFSATEVNGKIYAIGGKIAYNATPLITVEEYDPTTDTWTRKAPMPTARFGLSTCVVDRKIYAIGGDPGNSPATYVGLPTIEEYDPATDTWMKKSDMPTARGYLSASAVNGKVYAIGGGLELLSTSGLSTVEEYDPVTDTWTTKADMPIRRFLLASSAVNNKIYTIGGAVTPWNTWQACPTVEEYDTGLTAEEWSLAGTWFGTNSYGHVILLTITQSGPDSDQFAASLDITQDPSFGGLFPGTIAATNMRGTYVRTGLNTYDFTVMSYGLAEPAEGESARQVVYIQVVSGQTILTDEDTLASDLYTAALYAPDQDPFGYEPPAYGCYPVSGTYKRMPVVPVCELPPLEPVEE